MVQFRQIVLAALAAALIGGLAWSALHVWRIAPLIEAAEAYEAGGPVAHITPWGLPRPVWLVVGNLVTTFGYGLLLAAGYSLYGGEIGGRRGVLWGLAGYAAFMLAPALGLPPEPPGLAAAADVGTRQVWWGLTVLLSLLGLSLLVFAGKAWLRGVGIVLLLAPHVFSPAPAVSAGSELPPALAARFAATVLVLSAAFWALLGGVTGWVYQRLAEPQARQPGSSGEA